MTIDEAIAKERKKADLHRFNSCHIDTELYADDTEEIENAKNRCIKCAEEHEQLADWLEEWKDYRDKNKMVVIVDCNNIEDVKTIARAFVLACEEMSNCGCGDVELIKEYFIKKAGGNSGTDNQ